MHPTAKTLKANGSVGTTPMQYLAFDHSYQPRVSPTLASSAGQLTIPTPPAITSNPRTPLVRPLGA